MKTNPRFAAVAALTLALGPWSAASHADILGPTPYLGVADSPFAGLPGFQLEDFEDGLLNLPGVTASAGWIVSGPSVFSDSVDGGAAGHAFYSSGSQTSLTFTFDAAALGGHLPTHVGLVWTDVGNVFAGSTGFGDVTFTAFDAADLQIGPPLSVSVGDGTAFSSAAEDRFFGVSHAAGVKRITMSMGNSVDWEVDHLQYTMAVPEPSTYALLGLGALLIGARVAQRRKS